MHRIPWICGVEEMVYTQGIYDLHNYLKDAL